MHKSETQKLCKFFENLVLSSDKMRKVENFKYNGSTLEEMRKRYMKEKDKQEYFQSRKATQGKDSQKISAVQGILHINI